MKYEIELDDEEVKALESEVTDIFFLIHNFIHNRARQAIDRVCSEAVTGTDMLTIEDKQGIIAELSAAGIIITTVKGMPESVKRSVIKKATLKTAKEKSDALAAEIDAGVRGE